MRKDRIFTIPPACSFVDALALGLLAQAKGDPLALADTMVLLPTRRAMRGVGEAFLRASEGKALLLPRMAALADLDPDPLDLASNASQDDLDPSMNMPPPVSALRRQFLLARMIMAAGPALEQNALGAGKLAFDRAFQLAGELAKLIDQAATHGCDFADLAGLVPEEFASHWHIILDFLTMTTSHWPQVLADEGALDPADRQTRILEAQAELWRRNPPCTPVIAAGSTGSVPATARLLDVILDLPQGCVLLPGLDRHLEDAAWDALAPSHPQYGLAQLLQKFAIDRRHVRDWPYGFTGSTPERARLLSLALHPAPNTNLWQKAQTDLDLEAALSGLHQVVCANPQEEAGVIALMMRQTLERPGATCALVTPDRHLGRRVAAELRRWQIDIDDSAGIPLSQTPPGTLLRLCIAALAADLAPVPLLALLKHPLVALGLPVETAQELVRRLDRTLLRGPRPAPGAAGLRAAAALCPEEDLIAFVEAILARLAPTIEAMTPETTFTTLLLRHIQTVESLADTDQTLGCERLWQGDAGSIAAQLLSELCHTTTDLPAMSVQEYASILSSVLQMTPVRPRVNRHPRLAIWGALEARLQQADRLILAGLNEGRWPADPGADPWMSRAMRAKFKLPPWERRIGLAAHDFAQAFCAPDVFLVRSERVDGAPCVPSRWLRRLDAALQALGRDGLPVDNLWRIWHQALNRPDAYRPLGAPEPRPSLALRPRTLSATRVGLLLRDPYQIYAHSILKLQPLEALDADPSGAERGSLIHRALDLFVQAYPNALPERDLLPELLSYGKSAFGTMLERPEIWAFWWPRFVRMAEWILSKERERRPEIASVLTEQRGQWRFTAAGYGCSIKAVADRIELRHDGGRTIVDYKTGSVPENKDVRAGREPQLALEGLILQEGGFCDASAGAAGVPAGAAIDFEYWKLGGAEGGKIHPVTQTEELIDQAKLGVVALFGFFLNPDTPYYARAKPMPDRLARYDDYAHLARIAEWSLAS